MVSLRALALVASALTSLSTAAEPPLPPLTCLIFPPLVSPQWLNKCATPLNLVLIDLRSAAEYAASHIPHSFSLPFEPVSAWSTTGPGDLLLELPPSAAVRTALGAIGVTNTSKLVLINGVGRPAFPQAASPRVAITLRYAGLPPGRVAVLDGGFPAWVEASLPTSVAAPPDPVPAVFEGREDRAWLVGIDYVKSNLHKHDKGIYVIDGRDAAVYNGSVVEEWALEKGHIPSAVSLPAASGVWNDDGSWKGKGELLRQVREAVGYGVGRGHGQIIVSCGVGGYAATWYWVLTRVLGWERVVMYDGSAQEWSRFYDMEV